MNYIDVIIIIPLLWGIYKGFTKGLIIEVASFAALVLGIYTALYFSDFTSGLLTKYLDVTSQYLPVISFAITFIAVLVLVHFVARIVDKLIKSASLGIFNRLAGAVFGSLKFAIIIGIAIILLNRFDSESNLIKEETKSNSLLYRPLSNAVSFIYPKAEAFFQQNIVQEHPANDQNVTNITQ